MVHVRGHLRHGSKALLHLRQLLEILSILGLFQSIENLLNSLAVVEPLLNKRLGSRRGLLLGGVLLRCLTAGSHLRLRSIGLSLAAFCGFLGHSSRGGGSAGTSMVVMDALHVVLEVPLTWESIAEITTFAALVVAEERLLSMAVQTVSLTLVAKKTCCG